jgi:hypothetical protein
MILVAFKRFSWSDVMVNVCHLKQEDWLNRSAIWSSNPTPGDISKGMQHRLLPKHLHTHFYFSAMHNSQVMETIKMPHYWWMDWKKCGIYTQWNFTQPWGRTKSYHLQVNEWNWRTPSWAKLARLRRPKIICSPSYVVFRFRANIGML